LNKFFLVFVSSDFDSFSSQGVFAYEKATWMHFPFQGSDYIQQ